LEAPLEASGIDYFLIGQSTNENAPATVSAAGAPARNFQSSKLLKSRRTGHNFAPASDPQYTPFQ
jgi:hypothetical protein